MWVAQAGDSDAVARVLRHYVDDVATAPDERGKPHLVRDVGIRFNVSHSGALLLVAVADQEVGVDVQEVRPLHNPEGVARRVLSPREQEAGADFFQAWARKEAVLKATGEGIRRGLAEVEVCPPPPNAPWWVEDLDVGDGYVAAVAGLGPRVGIVRRRL